MLRVNSEIGRLRRALVHEPGPEVDRMVPAMMEQLLFDDILYGDRAREEFARFRRVLQLLGVEVLDAEDLLEQSLAEPGSREWLIGELLEDLPAGERARLSSLARSELASTLVTGARRDVERPGGVEADELYAIPPLPNWCFQRDPQIVLGGGVMLCSMAAPARRREALLARAIFRFHPALRDAPVWVDARDGGGSPPADGEPACLEGGDVLVFSPDVVVVGLSQRTNRGGVMRLCEGLARWEAGPRWLYVVEIPRRRAYMHLDTLLTQVDRDACLVYPPVLLPGGSEEAGVSRVDLRSRERSFDGSADLLSSLGRHGIDLEPIPCGGADPVTQQREQWTDGANALALAPGLITLYDRNVATAEALERHGFRILSAEDLLLGREELDPEDCGRVCVLISSHEMSRARGGPHCLVHPLVRDDLVSAGRVAR